MPLPLSPIVNESCDRSALIEDARDPGDVMVTFVSTCRAVGHEWYLSELVFRSLNNKRTVLSQVTKGYRYMQYN